MSAPRIYIPVKRAADVLAATAALIVLAPIMLAAALCIKLTSTGPVFFRQERAGRHEKPFGLIKFRTMRAGRTPDPKELVPLDHPEITRVGRVLRRVKIDELPQLFNVLTGHMSLIGPRPTLPDQVARYDQFELRRLDVRPGCTGLAQVNGNTALPWPERIKWDVHYVDNYSLWMDLKILLKTVGVIVLGEQRFVRRIDQAARIGNARE
jgi:lipopolysaccharide/colanic/teichoic acid biosynthesis glycosyltransferase